MSTPFSKDGRAALTIRDLDGLSEILSEVGALSDEELARLRELQRALGLCFGRAEWIRRRNVQRSFEFGGGES